MPDEQSDMQSWREAVEGRMHKLEASLSVLDDRCADIEGALMSNTGLTARTAEAAERTERKVDAFHAEMRGILSVVQGTRRAGEFATKTGRNVNRFARWLMPIVLSAGAVWAWLQNVGHPK